jgi:alpha-mannosidase
MHDDRALTESRIRRFTHDYLSTKIYQETAPVTIAAHALPGEPVPPAEAIAADYTPFEPGTAWGRAWSTLWLHVTGTVPADWAQDETSACELIVDLGFDGGGPGFAAEAQVWTPDGTPVKAINPFNRYLSVRPGEQIDYYLECAANPNVDPTGWFAPTDRGEWDSAGDEPLYVLHELQLARRDVRVWNLNEDFRALTGLMKQLPEDSQRRAEILRALETACDTADPDDMPGTADAARAVLRPVLERPAASSALTVHATGHAHIDSAWLWPVRETIRKCARTFSNAVTLMDEDPEFTFSVSSAQQYAWVKDRYPELFERIKEKVAEGRFVPVGGMWVESDTNMPGSEAMARQFVAGKRFFLENFGVETTETWLPDSFGYSAALPQIASLAGQPNFLTQKVSWNQINDFPHHSFNWEGLDGTSVFTHFPPADTYNGSLTQEELAYFERNFKDKGRASMGMDLFGWGDGGGGPTREMIAAGRRAADLEGSPKVEFSTPERFFEAARADYPDAPTWNGELYLELHRGTYSSQIATKQGNRRSEHVLHEAEFLASVAAVRAGYEYPYDTLEALWHDALLLQFHDILPGSAIAWVHRDTERNHASIQARAEQIIADATAALAGAASADAAGTEETVLLNTAPVARDGVAAYSAGAVAPAAEGVSVAREGEQVTLDNGVLRAVLDGSGEIVSLVDRASGREAIAPGAAGATLQLHRDTPNAWDSWDIDEFYRHVVRDLSTPTGVEVSEDGGGVRVAYTYTTAVAEGDETSGVTGAGSTIVKTFVLRPGDESLGIETDLDWHERKKALKLGFGLDVRAAAMSSEVQFGHVDRPIPVNTSWDFARWETCAHRWVHLAEGDYGVAIANDSTYGHDVLRTVREADGGTTTTARLTLIRSAEYPDPKAEEGQYSLKVAIRPGAGIREAVGEGYRINLPRREVPAQVAQLASAPVSVQGAPSVLVETVKLAEDRSGDLVLRLYESEGLRARATVRLDGSVAPAGTAGAIAPVDLLERPFEADAAQYLSAISPAGADGAGSDAAGAAGAAVELAFRPYEIKTLRIPRG